MRAAVDGPETRGAGRSVARGYLLAMMAGVTWSTMALLAKLIYRYPADPRTVLALRGLIVTATLFVILAARRSDALRVRRADLPLLVAYGMAMVFNQLGYFYALKLMTATVTAILFYMYPALVCVGDLLFFGVPFTRYRFLSVVLVMGGCFLVMKVYDPAGLHLNLPGTLFGVVAAVGMAALALIGRRVSREYSPWTSVFYSVFFSTLGFLALRGPAVLESLRYPATTWLLIVVMAWGPGLLGYVLYYTSMTHIEAGQASILTTLEPVLVSINAYAFLGERLDGLQWVGGAVVLAGIYVLRYSEPRNRRD